MSHLDEKRELAEFLRGELAPSEALETRVRQTIHARLNPRYGMVVAKLFAFHALGSFVTLLFCPQFGISLTGTSLLMPWLMDIHPALCFFGCGVLWMLIGQAMSYAFLSIDEHRVVGESEWGMGLGVLVLSILFFGCLGRIELDEWLVAWAGGALAALALFNVKLSLERRRVKALASSR